MQIVIDELTLKQLNWVKDAPLVIAYSNEEPRVWQRKDQLIMEKDGKKKK